MKFGIMKFDIMRRGMAGAMLPAMLAALLVAPGCAKKESAATDQTASVPPGAASLEPADTPQATASEATGPEATATETTDDAAAPAAEVSATQSASSTAAGEKVFKAYCVTCHGLKGKGDGPAAAALNPKPANFSVGAFKYDVNGNGTKGDIEDIKAIVHDGAAKHGGSPLMAPWPTIQPEQLQAVAEYVKSLHGA
ncbi:hypothetical protein ACG33_08685 [Steroidobacter denitrificans]|uniref:Cytochrome c domain-containing protein n=2 Tax=Steroidobacter denitrificans TaxID=465721 RepID=A0A127FC55_STEDE|nr:hypothetical protein ACG33_08685 [Steroidobacter denitrificans]